MTYFPSQSQILNLNQSFSRSLDLKGIVLGISQRRVKPRQRFVPCCDEELVGVNVEVVSQGDARLAIGTALTADEAMECTVIQASGQRGLTVVIFPRQSG
jgi:hypothetical protein